MKTKILFILITITSLCNAQTVTIPDVNFKNALTNSSCVDADLNGSYESDADLNNDGQIQSSEASVIQRLRISGKSISDLTGIQSFTNIKKLLCNNNLLTTVDFSSNLNLQEIDCNSNRFVSLSINGLSFLNTLNIYPNILLQNLTVTNNPLLTTLTLGTSFGSLSSLVSLNCSNNAINSLSFFNDGYPFTNLTTVDCSFNRLTSISLNTAITNLNVSNNLFTTFSLSKPNIVSLNISNNNLTTLDVYNCGNLSSLQYSGNPNLNVLGITNTNITTLSIHDLINLQTFNCGFNTSGVGTPLTSLEIYNLPSLINFNCVGNNISTLVIANFPNLTNINYGNNPNVNLTLSNLPSIINYSTSVGSSISINNMSNLSTLTFNNNSNFSDNFDNIYIDNNNLLSTINFTQNTISQFQLTNLPNLTTFNFRCIQTTPYNLSINSLPNLTNVNLDIKNNCNLSLTNLPLLYQIEIKGVTTFNIHDLPQLYRIKSQQSILTNFTLNNLPSLYELLLNNNAITSLNLQNLPNLYTVDVSNNDVSTISLVNLPLLHDMNFEYNLFPTTNAIYSFSNLPNLYSLNFNRTSVDSILLNNLPSLYTFNLDSNPNISNLSFNNLPSLYNITIMQCSTLNSTLFQNLNSFYKLKIYNIAIQGINLSNLPNLYDVEIFNNSNILNNSIILSNLSSLFKLNLSYNGLDTFNFNSLPNLQELNISSNDLQTIYLQNLVNLRVLNISGNNLYLLSLDLSSNPNISHINYSTGWIHDKLKYINLRNGNSNLTSIIVGSGTSTSVTRICVDSDSEKLLLQSLDSSLANTVFTTYCSFNPAGTFYTVEGTSLLDTNNNGCGVGDISFPMINLNIESAGITNSHFANNSGNYSLPLSAGQYTITPAFENPGFYSFSPSSINVTFPSNISPYNQNFCVLPNGNHNDLEINILPISSARPGFDAAYKLVFKNKGTTVQTGTINFTFNDSFIDYVLSNQSVSNQSIGSLTWNFTNLLPFETREINFILNLNSPTESPALNSNDILNFTASINGQTDEIPNDNISLLNQIVVNSYDPNDKTCLEGITITPNMVGEYVHYLIRFENNGTANAQNIVVKDMIDTSKFDINTLIPIKGSHNFETRISSTNKVEFIFKNINLPFDNANNDGYVSFKIKTKPNLVVGNTFSNLANIYFDYNFPIVTNNYTTTIQNTLSLQEYNYINDIVAYPNPVKDILRFKTEHSIFKIEVYDIAGRILSSNSISENIIDLSALKTGDYILKLYTDKGIRNTKIMKE
jgi:hypothetical protein